jgi:hypothetical protein
MYTELKEVLMPLSAKEVEYFNEATASCTDEQKLAVAKRMSGEQLPHGYQFTESQIKRFVAQESLSRVNWYPGINVNNGAGETVNVSESQARLKAVQERQFKTYRKSGMSEVEASAASGFKPEQTIARKSGLEKKNASTLQSLQERQYNTYRASGLSEAEAIGASGFTPKTA